MQLPGAVGAVLTFISMSVYLALSLLNYKKFRNIIKQTESAEDLISMRGIFIVLLMNIIVLLVNISNVILYLLTQDSLWVAWSEVSLFIALAISTNIFILTGLTQNLIFKGVSNEDVTIEEMTRDQIPSLELEETLHHHLKNILSEHMSSRKPFIEPMFNLQTLARQLGESPRNVSVYINHHLHLTFADFVNRYRIEEAKLKMVNETEKGNIIDIAYACGFSTKSNFNRAFKKYEGKTPSQFKRLSKN
jgi:AraC-like DNA-binding protein